METMINSRGTVKRVFLVANTCWYLYNFRLALLRDLAAKGYIVEVVAPLDSYTRLLQKDGFIVHEWALSRKSINPLVELKAIIDLLRIYMQEQPQLVHHFTIKACIYGTIAAKGAGVYRVVNAVTGLGHVFLGTRKRSKLLRLALKPLYRKIFTARRATIVFQNIEDQEKLIMLGIADSEKSRLIPGSGVDIDRFCPTVDTAGCYKTPLQLLFPSRLIREKGIYELLEACNSLWDRGIKVDLLLAGEHDTGNRSALDFEELRVLRNDTRIHWLGHVDDMPAVYAASDLVVLPSWREGLSRALIEAASMERPIITTDVPGCRDVIEHGKTGLLVPLQNSHAIELAIILMLENPNLARRFGKAARKKVLQEFQVSLVNDHTLAQYEQLFASPHQSS